MRICLKWHRYFLRVNPMAERTDTSIRINGDRKIKLERTAVDLTTLTKKIVKMSDVVNYMIDNYLQDAKKDMQAKSNKESGKK